MQISSTQSLNMQGYICAVASGNFDVHKYRLSASSTDSFSQNHDLDSRAKELKAEFEAIQNEQGFIGKAWDKCKNVLNTKRSSKKTFEAIEKFKKGELSREQAQNELDKYRKGQQMSVDFAGDVVSGIVGLGAFMLAVPTGGLSLGVGLGITSALGAGAKVLTKYLDAKSGKREYRSVNYDVVTGAINGILAPITNGLANTLIKNVATKAGINVAVKGTQQAATGRVSAMILNQGIKLTGVSLPSKLAAKTASKAIAQPLKLGAAFFMRSISFGYLEHTEKTTKRRLKILAKITGNEEFNKTADKTNMDIVKY